MPFDIAGAGRRPVTRRSLLTAAGTVALVATVAPALPAGAAALGGTVLDRHRAAFAELRALGQGTGGRTLIPRLVREVRQLTALASTTRVSGESPRALALAARVAEYTGWLAQESGDEPAARSWTRYAVELAEGGGDPEMRAYCLVRHGLLALYRRDAAQTVSLARAARDGSRTSRVRGLAAQREAQGYALAGDYNACMRAIDVATGHLYAAPPADQPLGSTYVPDLAATAAGWCLVDVGRPAGAAEILARQLDRIPPHALRARARYGTRLALAHAKAGELDRACAAVAPVLDTVGALDSATIRVDLGDLARALARWRADPVARPTWHRLVTTGVAPGR